MSTQSDTTSPPPVETTYEIEVRLPTDPTWQRTTAFTPDHKPFTTAQEARDFWDTLVAVSTMYADAQAQIVECVRRRVEVIAPQSGEDLFAQRVALIAADRAASA